MIGKNCSNCGAELYGRYCHECGQKASSIEVSMHEFVHEAADEFLHLDNKIIHTVRVLATRPGQISEDFIKGRRKAYISPLRLYLTFSVLFFFIAATVPGAHDWFLRFRGDDQAQEDAMRATILANIPRVVFALMPVFALLTFAFFRHRHAYFVPHFYHSIHLHAFAFLVFTVTGLLSLLGPAGKLASGGVSLLLFAYYFSALRRFFGESWGRTILKGTAIGFLYVTVLAISMAAVLLFAFRRLGL